ncbi:MAG: hypothetical protein SGBAC_004970 [Bacillariaceae sp.]
MRLFDLLAAAYETLVDKESRQRYNFHLSSIEDLKYTRGLAGEMYVGGKRLGTNRQWLIPEPEVEVAVPELVRSDSASTLSSTASGASLADELVPPTKEHNVGCETETTAESNTTDSVEVKKHQISEEEKERIQEGPLKDLFEAREWVPFSDSQVVFEQVFGRSSKIAPNGKSRVFTTSRILYDKRVTRMETFTDDPVTGARTKSTTVTSEPICKDVVEEEVQTCFTICGGGTSPKAAEKKKSDEEPLLQRNNEEEPSSSCFCKDLLHGYYDLCSQLYDEFRMIGLGYYNMI